MLTVNKHKYILIYCASTKRVVFEIEAYAAIEVLTVFHKHRGICQGIKQSANLPMYANAFRFCLL